jgi:DNA-binding transcriptional MocR family regulator
VVTNGGLEALNLALRAVVKPGEVVAVESPTYFGILQAIESLGVRAVEVPSHPKKGINLELLEHAIRRHKAKAVVVMTNCHNPQGTIMSDAAKKQLVELTHEHDVAVIEDDIYGDLAYVPVRPRTAKSYDRKGLVLLCGSFSKVLAPGLRVGWIEAGRFRARVEVLKSITSLATSSLPQLAVNDLLESGFYERYVRRMRIRIEDQVTRYSNAIAELFPEGTRMSKPAGGSILWLQLPGKSDGTRLYHRALQAGISVVPGEVFSASGKHRGFVRVSCGTPWSPRIERALATLAQLARQ